MEEKSTAVNTTEAAAPQTTVAPAVTETDAEVKIAALEAEKSKLIEESANYKLGMLKAKGKIKEDEDLEETTEEMVRRISAETLANSRLAEIAREQDTILKAALKENKELKLANHNKTNVTPPASMGTHTESAPVADTAITPEQLSAFKARGWTDKDIERYKQNLRKHI